MALGFSSLGGAGGLSASSSASAATGDQSFGSDFIINQGGSTGGASPSMTWASAAAAVAGVVFVAALMRRA